MLSVRAVLAKCSTRPPLVLVHGAANSAVVGHFWQAALTARGWSSWARDLRGPAADPGRTTMSDYADDAPVERLVVEGASHWSLVLSSRLLATLGPAVLAWLRWTMPGRAAAPAAPGL